MFYTYIIQSLKNKHWYTGCTSNLWKRFREHNDNLVLSTKGRGPFILIYYEACLNKDDAFTRERYLKSGMGPVRNFINYCSSGVSSNYLTISNGVGKRYLKNRLKRFLSLTG